MKSINICVWLKLILLIIRLNLINLKVFVSVCATTEKIDSFECNQSEIQFVEWQSVLNSVNSVFGWQCDSVNCSQNTIT